MTHVTTLCFRRDRGRLRSARAWCLALVFATGAALAAPEQRVLLSGGVDADKLGQAQGYPACIEALRKPECRVGTWSGQERTALTSVVRASGQPLPLPFMADPPEITFRWGLTRKTVDEYLAETKATGFIVLKDGQVVIERYQYGRTPDMRFRSFSMAKTFTSMLVGIAHHKGFIKSLDDKAADYWPEIAASAYGQTSLRGLLRMGSGVPFKELYTWTPDDDNWVWGRVLYAPENRRQPERVAAFLNGKTEREVPEGTRFKYASIETEILGRVLTKATGKSVTQLTEDWLWGPMGAESDARWNLSTTDWVEATSGGFNATLRDYARFGHLLAHDGQRDAVAILPREYLLDATDPQRLPDAFKPRVATGYFGYGYRTWVFPLKERTFALQGIHGQVVFVQPATKIVMVQTSVFDYPSGRFDPTPWQRMQSVWMGVLQSLGGVTE
jgi:CubicO group peptidase (beta-lactamase class C family)